MDQGPWGVQCPYHIQKRVEVGLFFTTPHRAEYLPITRRKIKHQLGMLRSAGHHVRQIEERQGAVLHVHPAVPCNNDHEMAVKNV
jgi:hypothetical protein